MTLPSNPTLPSNVLPACAQLRASLQELKTLREEFAQKFPQAVAAKDFSECRAIKRKAMAVRSMVKKDFTNVGISTKALLKYRKKKAIK